MTENHFVQKPQEKCSSTLCPEKRGYSFLWITLTNVNVFLQNLPQIIPMICLTEQHEKLLSVQIGYE